MEPVEAIELFQGIETISTRELPGWEDAWIPETKLTDYILNPASERGQHKAHLFQTELGIEQQHWRFLHDQLLGGFSEGHAAFHGESEYGTRWTVPILVTGCNEAVRWVTTGWIVQYSDPRPKLTTAYLKRSPINKELRLLESRFDLGAAVRRLPVQRAATATA